MRRPERTGRAVAAVVLAATLGGCAARRAPEAPAPAAPIASVEALRAELDDIFHAPAFGQGLWGVLVQSLDTGEVLYRLNPITLMMPASNMKLVTLAVAADRLGWDFRYETRLETRAPIVAGRLEGDLVVVGSGDPSIGADAENSRRELAEWAARLRDAGITQIAGRIVGDDDAFEDRSLGAAWSWDDLPFGYAAPVGALQYHENVATLTIGAGEAVGAPASVEITPPTSGLAIDNRISTGAADAEPRLELYRLPGQPTLELSGTVPLGSAARSRTISVDNPTLYFVRTLKAVLVEAGIGVDGDAVDIDDLAEPGSDREWGEPEPRVLYRHLSPPLSELGAVLMKVSQNLYAETFLKTLAAQRGTGTDDEGRAIAEEVLASWGIPDAHHVIYDGSGLSRNNYLTAELLVKILREMHRRPEPDRFVATLPVGGIDGTLAGRLKGTRAEGIVKAKTGSIANVRSLSGYLTTLGGETLAFAILGNHFKLPPRAITDQIDLAVERLANLSRRP